MADNAIDSSQSASEMSADAQNNITDEDASLNSPKKRKTYENRKNSLESQNTSTNSDSPKSDISLCSTASVNMNTSRYGRARKPKITEDFYNIEDIFGPYERITSSPSRCMKKKTTKLELSPSKNKDSVNLTNSVHTGDIPEENNTEVTKVMKLVSTNSAEFSHAISPTFPTKPIKTYTNRNKRTTGNVVESFALPDYPSLENLNATTSDSLNEPQTSSTDGVIDFVKKNVDGQQQCSESELKQLRLFSDESFNSCDSSPEKPLEFPAVCKNPVKSRSLRQTRKSEVNVDIDDKTSNSEENREKITLRMDCKQANVGSTELSVPKVKKNLKLSLEGKNKSVQVFDKKQNVGKTRVVLLKKAKSSDKDDRKASKTVKKHVNGFNTSELTEIGVKTNEDAADDAIYMPDVGALAWSRVGTYPFWPSLVTNEPGLDRHYKLTMVGRKQVKCYHVNFFGDNGRRSWVLASHIFPFQKRSDLEIMARTVTKKSKPKDPKHLSAYIVNSNKLNKWETAVTEAESLTEYSSASRIEKFFEMVGSKKSEKVDKKRKLSAIKSPRIDAVHKRAKLDHKLLTPKKYRKKFLTKPAKKPSPKTSPTLETIGIKIEKNSDDENADETSAGLEEKVLKKRAKVIDKIRQSDATNSDAEKTSSDSVKRKTKPSLDVETVSDESFSDSDTKVPELEIKREVRDTPSPVPVMSQAARYKRINVFRGITKDRVCQICGKLNNVVKCKGSCFGLFHIECDSKVRQRVLAKKLTENSVLVNVAEDSDSTRDSLDSVKNNRSSSCSVDGKSSDEGLKKSGENNDAKPPDKVDDASREETTGEDVSDSDDKSGSTSSSLTIKTDTSENPISTGIETVTAIIGNILDRIFEKQHEESVTVESPRIEAEETHKSTLNEPGLTSPVKKGERTLSLAEKIDLKMQEVMLSLTEQTKYSDSTTDEGSEPEDTSEVSYTSASPEVEVKKLETESMCEYSHLPMDSLESTVVDSQTSEPLSNQSSQQASSESVSPETDSSARKNSKTIKRIVKHVTADGIFDIIEEDEVDVTDYSTFKCTYCSLQVLPPCFICAKDVARVGGSVRHKCMTPQCGKYYHSECLKEWPQAKWLMSTKSNHIDNENLCCPYHNCHTCISDDPRGPNSRHTKEKLAKCIRCPTTYHINSYCIPAGTEILSTYQIMCPKHVLRNELGRKSKAKFMPHVNASWCFICSMGGSLICCETCPSSFHVECLKLSPPEGRYLCEECESGRLPLYDEIVWVKLGAYRWWPAQILFPNEVPENVRNIPHNNGEFVVKFFGSHDHYWVNRGRVFLFQEGDTGHSSSKKSSVDGLFLKAIAEATRAHKKFQDERANRAAEARNGMKPPPYTKIKVNRPVGDVRTADADTSNTTPCDCDPNWELPCGPDSDCLNRILLTECNPAVCAASTRCCNQAFEKRQYQPLLPFKTSGRGWGLKSLAPIKKGAFVIEYVGEVINEKEYRRRMKRKHEQKDENYYFLTIDKDRMIDAGPKGNVARFMNHSCAPNCETQKWTVNGDTRVGLFAIMDILTGAELTFNYNLECIGEEKKECHCKASNCSGFIGVKAKQDDNLKKRKSSLKPKKKKPSITVEVKPAETVTCFVCGEPDAVQQCDRDACHKCYHLHCVDLEWPPEGKWLCPWHSCNVCTKRTSRCCYTCMNSYCPLHSEGNIRYDRVKGFICTQHDPRMRRKMRAILLAKTKENESSASNENSQDIKSQDKPSEAETPVDDVDFVKPTKDAIPSRRSSKSMKPEVTEANKNTEDGSSEPKDEEPITTLTKPKKPTNGERKSSRLTLESADKSEELLEDNSSTKDNTKSSITADTEPVEESLEDVSLEKRREHQEEHLEELPLTERIKEQSIGNDVADMPLNKRREEVKEEILQLVQKVTHSNNLLEGDIENVSLEKRRGTNDNGNNIHKDNDDMSLDKRRDATSEQTSSQSVQDVPKKLRTKSNIEKNADSSVSNKETPKNDVADEDISLAKEVPKKLRTLPKPNMEGKKNDDSLASNTDTSKNDVSEEDIPLAKAKVSKKLRTLQKSNEMKKHEDSSASPKGILKNDVTDEENSLAKEVPKKLRNLQKLNAEMKKPEEILKNEALDEDISLAKVKASKKVRTLQKSNMDAKKNVASSGSNKETSKNDVSEEDNSLPKATSKKVRTLRNKSHDAESKKCEDNTSNKDATKNDMSDEEISLAQLKDAGNLFLKELTTKKRTVTQRSSNNVETLSESKKEDISSRKESTEIDPIKEEPSDKEQQNAAQEADVNEEALENRKSVLDSTQSDSESDFKPAVHSGKKRKLRLSLRHSSDNAAELKSRSSKDRRSLSEDEDDKPLVSFKKIKLEINNFLNKIKDSVNMKRSQDDAKKKDRDESKATSENTEGKMRRTTRHSSSHHVDFNAIKDSLNLQLDERNLKKRRLSASEMTSSDDGANASSESDFEETPESFRIKNVNIKKLNSSKLAENSPKKDKRKKVVRASAKKDVWRNKIEVKMKKHSSPANEETQSSDKEKVRIEPKAKKPRLNVRKSEEKQEDTQKTTHTVQDKPKKSKLNPSKTEQKEVSKDLKANSKSTDSKSEENKVLKNKKSKENKLNTKSSAGIKNSLRSHQIIELNDSKSSSSEAVKMKVPIFSDDETVESLKSQSADSETCDSQDELNISASSTSVKTISKKKFNLSLRRKSDPKTPKSDSGSNKSDLKSLQSELTSPAEKSNVSKKVKVPKIASRKSLRNTKCDGSVVSSEENHEIDDHFEQPMHNSTLHDDSADEMLHSSVESVPDSEMKASGKKSKISSAKLKTFRLGSRKSLRYHKTDELSESLDENRDVTDGKVDGNLMSPCSSQSEDHFDSSVDDDRSGSDVEQPADPNNSVENVEVEEVKRKRGRPRKYPKDYVKYDGPKRPRGRPRKHVVIADDVAVQNVESVTELYKMKLNTDTLPKNPYENHVNEVKLTSNVPERHLRVVLRKHSEFDSKIDSKFLRMQNDIERDLPIRKRSKLRYEAQL